MGGGRETIMHLLFHDDKKVSWVLVAGRFFGPLLSYLSGCAGGIFAPSLAAGAVIGAKIAELVHSPYVNLMVILSMTAFLSGVTRTPFTSAVLVLEMTDRHAAILPLMIASLVGSLITKLIDSESFYEHRRDLFLEEFVAKHLRSATENGAPDHS